MQNINQINDAILKIELDLQYIKDAVHFGCNANNTESRLLRIIEQSQIINSTLNHNNLGKNDERVLHSSFA
jgi:hypothetical protein